jgi:hypothetical protein
VTDAPAQDLETEATSAPPPANSVTLRLANGPLSAPVLGRVISMVLARADCPMDRLDEAIILCDALSAYAPAHARDRHVVFTMTTDDGELQLRIGELAEQGASRLLADAAVPGVGNVLERLTDGLRIELPPAAPESSIAGACEELVLTLRFG